MRRRVVLVQLPIPPLGPEPIRGNVPLAGAYLKMFAEQQKSSHAFAVDLFPTLLTNTLGDRELAQAILETEPYLVGFTCYLWNINRTLWLCEHLKRSRPELKIILGGPEITLDNAWVLASPWIDYAAIGEGEQTFAELLDGLSAGFVGPIDGLAKCGSLRAERGARSISLGLPLASSPPNPSAARYHDQFAPRHPLPNLEAISSPYLAGILDAADEGMLLLETLRGCIFKCKFCYYPKAYDDLYYLSEEKILANLRHAHERGAKEVVLLDPTLNQGRNFENFVRLLIRGNPDRSFSYFGELRAEGITRSSARLLQEANFTEVEIGLQSIDPLAMKLMDRNNNLRAVENGIRALRDVGIRVKVDLILGLPGDTPDSIRSGIDYLLDKRLYDDIQVFNLAVLPGTTFRHEAEQLGLVYQERPPYYVQRTPTLRTEELHALMAEAETAFGIDWDPLPPPSLSERTSLPNGIGDRWIVDLDTDSSLPPRLRTQAFLLWLRSADIARTRQAAVAAIRRVLDANPFTTLQIVVEPTAEPETVTLALLEHLWAAALERPTYLDRYYAMQPGKPIGAKRLVVLLQRAARCRMDSRWLQDIKTIASVAWIRAGRESPLESKPMLTEST